MALNDSAGMETDVASVLFYVGHDLQRVICKSLFSPETHLVCVQKWTRTKKWFQLNFWQRKSVSRLLTKESVKFWRIIDFTAISTHWWTKMLKKQMDACLFWSVVLRLSTLTPAGGGKSCFHLLVWVCFNKRGRSSLRAGTRPPTSAVG